MDDNLSSGLIQWAIPMESSFFWLPAWHKKEFAVDPMKDAHVIIGHFEW